MKASEIIERIERQKYHGLDFDVVMNSEFIKNLDKKDQIVFWRTGDLNILRQEKYTKHFPESDIFESEQYESIAVVGNSGSIVDSGFGSEIDDHEFVLRFNSAPTKGYEEDVGSKTTHRMAIGTLHFRESENEKYLRSYRKNSQAVKDLSRILPEDWLYVLTHHFTDWVQGFKDNEKTVCSSGFMGVMLALVIGETVDLYGFNLPEHDEFDYHYYNKSRYVEKSHNFKREHEIYNMLNRRLNYFRWRKNF